MSSQVTGVTAERRDCHNNKAACDDKGTESREGRLGTRVAREGIKGQGGSGSERWPRRKALQVGRR